MIATAAAGFALAAPAAPGATAATDFRWYQGYDEASTPSKLDKVGVLKVGPRKAKKVLILNPGTSGAAAYFYPLARLITKKTANWQVWSIERRGTQLEDQSVFDQVKLGEATVEEMADYYLLWLTDPTITDHFEFIPDSEVGFGREWGMRVAVEDLKRVVDRANRKAKTVVMGGHSLGGSITSAYATWDFDGRPGARGLDGLVFIDGGSGPDPSLTPVEATDRLNDLAAGSPWLSFGGIDAPFSGLFNSVGADLALFAPDPQPIQGLLLLGSELCQPGEFQVNGLLHGLKRCQCVPQQPNPLSLRARIVVVVSQHPSQQRRVVLVQHQFDPGLPVVAIRPAQLLGQLIHALADLCEIIDTLALQGVELLLMLTLLVSQRSQCAAGLLDLQVQFLQPSLFRALLNTRCFQAGLQLRNFFQHLAEMGLGLGLAHILDYVFPGRDRGGQCQP